MTNTDTNGPSSTLNKKERSPNFPFITLSKALERARTVYSATKRYDARLADMANALGTGVKSSGTLQTLSAMISYGLLEDNGSGDTRKFKISELGFKALEDNRPGAKETALAEAALKPKLIAEYFALWGDDRPIDSISVSELRMERGFTEDGAKAFLRVYDDAIRYAVKPGNGKQSDADSKVAAQAADPIIDTNIEIGDLVQWESGGVLRLEKPTAVRAFHDHEGHLWAFVEDSETGIPMEELILQQKAPPAPRVPPTMPLEAKARPESISAPGMEEDRFTVDEGVVRVEFPKGMGAASVDELDQFFKLFIKKAARRAGNAS